MKFTKLCLIAVLVGTVAVIGCSEDAQGTGGSGGSAGSGGGGTGGTPAEDCADADLVCAACEEDTVEWERCLGAVFLCNEVFDPSECEGCIENSQPARDCDGAGGAGGSGGTAGGGGTGGTPAEDCADSGLLCAACEEDTVEWERCLGAVFLCNEVFDPSECEGCVDSLQPGSDCDGSGGTGGAGGTGGNGGTAGSGGTSGEIPACNESLCARDQARRDKCEEFIPECIVICEDKPNCGPAACSAFARLFICNEQ